MSEVVVDFVAFDDERDAVVLVFVEEDWSNDIEKHLYSLQDRFFTAIASALDGDLAEKFPKSKGRKLILRVDCYDLPNQDIDQFAERFSTGIAELPDFSTASSPYVRDVQVEVHHDTLQLKH